MCLMLVSPPEVSALRLVLAGCLSRELRVGVAGIGGARCVLEVVALCVRSRSGFRGWKMGAAVPGWGVSEGEVDWEGKSGFDTPAAPS
jgi:hypothetical protein